MFLFRLAAQLGMTVAQLCEQMSSTELSEWMAVHRYFMPLQDSWHQTGVLASSMLAPYAGKGKTPKPSDFIPIDTPPQHPVQMLEQLTELQKQLRGS